MRPSTLPALFFLLLGLASANAQALSVRISPLRIDLSARTPTAEVQLSNLGKDPGTVQIELVSWAQGEAGDVYTPSKDVVFTPPIATLKGLQVRTVRFRLRAPADATQERSYRVYFKEIPTAGEAAPAAGMSFRMRFGVPLFVAAQAAAKPVVKGEVQRLADGTLRVQLANSGRAHLKVHDVQLVRGSAPGSGTLLTASSSEKSTSYVLPGSRDSWLLKADAAHPVPAGKDGLRVLVRTDHYNSRDEGYTPEGWLWLPLP